MLCVLDSRKSFTAMIDSEDRPHLERANLFASVSLESIEHLFERCHRLNLERGDHLLEAGAANSHLYLILGGELRVYLTDRNMPEHAVLVAGDCVGEMSLLDGHAASALVLAAKDTQLLAVPQEVLWSMVDCSHGVARNLLAIFSGRMRDNNQALVAAQSQSLEFEQAVSVDALTGIHNRHWALEAFPRAIARCEHDGDPLCMVMADIDLFKHFNERYGHLAGDAVLRRMAHRLADGLRPQDLIARYGGEEFLILLPHATLAEVLPIAERLRELVAIGSGLPTGDGLTLSCGVAQMFRGESLDELLARVDAALRRAKEDGRDRVEVAG
jgi:diguanylate cyclase (GGDEF)-like protein